MLLLSALLASCGGTDDSPDVLFGPCYHGYAEPVLTLEFARSAASGQAIGEVALSAFAINGQPVTVEKQFGVESMTSQPSFNVRIENGLLHCTLPCGFGIASGRYEFSAAAQGHRTKRLHIDAAYAALVGNCPSFSTEGTVATLELVAS